MPNRWSDRWLRNEDGTYVRNTQAAAPGGYEEMTKAELEAELEARGLPKTGNKAELVARLEEDDAEEA
jgi:hypothetical protein